MFESLGSRSIDIHVSNNNQQTALWLAVENREDLPIQWITESEEFDINQEDNEIIQKVASWAVDHEKEDIIRLFLQLRGSHTSKEIEQVVRVLNL
jgi:hypothetical protein